MHPGNSVPAPDSRVRVLGFHAAYACRHSGACCTAGWRIPVEDGVARALDEGRDSGRLPPEAARTLTSDGLTVLQLAPGGACTAFEPARGATPALCAIHRVLGPAALPAACRHFPRVCLLDPRGVGITLSHFCPTAASLLFDEGPISVVEAPPGFADLMAFEGLDAREALPPLLAPGMLMDLESYAAWEAHALAVLADERWTPEGALERLGAEVEALRTWTPRAGRLLERVLALGTDPHPGTDPFLGSVPVSGSIPTFSRVLACVPDGLAHPGPPDDCARLDRELVSPAWSRWHGPLRRYLAARLHASWVAYQGRGLRSVVNSLCAALAVVRVEAARACGTAGRPLDRSLLLEAVRMADLLLVHEADRSALATACSEGEGGQAR